MLLMLKSCRFFNYPGQSSNLTNFNQMIPSSSSNNVIPLHPHHHHHPHHPTAHHPNTQTTSTTTNIHHHPHTSHIPPTNSSLGLSNYLMMMDFKDVPSSSENSLLQLQNFGRHFDTSS